MVKRASVPDLDGYDFRAEFFREEREELSRSEYDDLDNKPKRRDKGEERRRRSKDRAQKTSHVPLPIPTPVAVSLGVPAKKRNL